MYHRATWLGGGKGCGSDAEKWGERWCHDAGKWGIVAVQRKEMGNCGSVTQGNDGRWQCDAVNYGGELLQRSGQRRRDVMKWWAESM